MIPLTTAVSGELTWSKISCKNYELRRNGEMLGTLERPSFWSSTYLAETPAGNWTFRPGGFLGSGAEILDSATKQVIATFKSAWGGRGVLTFADGQKFTVESTGLWRPVWDVNAEGGQTILRLHAREKNVELFSAAVSADRLSLLAMFIYYRLLKSEEDAAVAVVAVVVST